MPIDHELLRKLSAFDCEVLEGIASYSSERIAAQLESANAADQRSMACAALFASIATLLATGLAITLDIASEKKLVGIGSGSIPLFILSLGYFVSAALCIYGSKSKEFCFPGVRPSQWTYDSWATRSDALPDKKQFFIEYIAEIEKAIGLNKDYAYYRASIFNAAIDVALFTSLGVFIFGASMINSRLY